MKKITISIILSIFLTFISCKSIPNGETGEKAEYLAKKMLEYANIDAWKKTEAVEFTFAGIRHHLWDKKRNYVLYQKDNTKVYFKKDTLEGKVFIDNKEILESELKNKKIKEAYSAFINDFFWLQPAFHIYSPGTKRFFIEDNKLRVTFYEGGVTPGDTYVFYIDNKGKIEIMQMWVKIIPIKGIKAEFKDYIETETGVRIAKVRETFLKNIILSNIKFYKSFPVDKDPFMEIF
ncbi:MAG: hypothetical protein KatS3mg129_0389 [Leptospiraceae bacterium]|nr:MAG: hypothetical protein KatS3mg129_0389 [Leptospiraceae bacterium]